MEIKSDKANKQNPGIFTKSWNYLIDDLWKVLMIIIAPFILYGWYIIFPDDYIWLMIASSGIVFVIGLMADGELFSDIKGLLFVFFGALFGTSLIFYIVASVDTEIDTMDFKPYITNIKANKTKDAFIINSKLPFESNIEITFTGVHEYDPLFTNKEHFDEFSITAIKSCSSYRIKSSSCTTSLKITHRDSGQALIDKILYNSVYPKKLAIETADNG